MIKDNSTFATVMTNRINGLKPIIHFWAQGKVESAISILNNTDSSIVSDATAAILKCSKFRFGITPEVAVKLLLILTQLMKNKHGTYVRSAMHTTN